MPKSKRILFLLPYPLRRAPSQRFRVEAFFPLLKEAGHTFSTHTFFDAAAWKLLYGKGAVVKKGLAVVKGFVSRSGLVLFTAWRYDFVFIHREAAPLGAPVFEWLLTKVLRKKVIFDFDDAIWIPNTTKENLAVRWVKSFWKVKYICRWAYKISGGNAYLCAYAKNHNDSVIKIPTTVDVLARHNRLKESKRQQLVIGWTGSHSTLHYLDEIVPVLQNLQKEKDFTFLVISNKRPELPLKNWHFIAWKEDSEIEDLLRIDIGIMPLKRDDWSEGKCGFKLIQYLALGIPAVASDVGVNGLIVQQDISGYLCTTPQEWYQALKQLLDDEGLRAGMGREGREKIVNEYSLQSQYNTFLGLFE